ncbi:MAG TPA: hypothetical protein VK564_05650 [Thermodesulfobacteriota bacterium]|nr:hypothetical protein [Thermodesulfobacteriota bacterium]
MKIKKIKWVLFMVFCGFSLLLNCPWALGQSLDLGPFPWGSSLENLNSDLSEKNQVGQIREDTYRLEIEIQYSPTKSVKIRKGSLVALNWSANPSMSGRLYGYAYEGKLFGRVFYFKDYPEIFPETAIGTLKKKYPEGRIYRSFTRDRFISLFEYKTDQLYAFTTERGIFFYDTGVLEKVAKKYQTEKEEEIKRFEDKQPDETKMTK